MLTERVQQLEKELAAVRAENVLLIKGSNSASINGQSKSVFDGLNVTQLISNSTGSNAKDETLRRNKEKIQALQDTASALGLETSILKLSSGPKKEKNKGQTKQSSTSSPIDSVNKTSNGASAPKTLTAAATKTANDASTMANKKEAPTSTSAFITKAAKNKTMKTIESVPKVASITDLSTSNLTTILPSPRAAASKASESINKESKQAGIQTASKISSPTSNGPSSDGKLFYMYDLDKEFWWRWPLPGTDCSGNGYVGHEHAALSGMGVPLIPENGLFLTWHFSLFSSLYNRMKRSKRRTKDPEKASMFIIPYDLGLDGYLNAQTCANSRQCTRGLAPKLQKILSNSTYFRRYNGGDHVVLWSLGQYHPWPHNGCDIFMKDFCSRCTFTCYWMDSSKVDNRFISVPFPSGYHWWDGIKNLPWDISNANSRNMTAVYLGSTQTLNPAHTKIRRAMTAQCNSSSDCHWMQIAHTSKDTSIGDYLSVYKRAVFCLCPPGDDPARKAVFDSILSGCIPVIFEKATLYNQYPWHLGEDLALDISVSIPGGLVRSGKLNFMDVLMNIPKDIIRMKQEALAKVAPRVQYAMPPLASLQDPSDETPWDPPFPDGVDITLDGLFERTSHVIRDEPTGIPKANILAKGWSQEYEVVIVKTPGQAKTGRGVGNVEGKGDRISKPLHRQHHKGGGGQHHKVGG